MALDYNAAIPGLAAMMVSDTPKYSSGLELTRQVLNNSADPYYVIVQANTYSIPAGQPCDAALPCGGSLSGGAIAGIVLGGLAFLALLGLLVWCSRRLRKRA